MQFKHPEILYALLLLVIPIIIHCIIPLYAIPCNYLFLLLLLLLFIELFSV